jgi:hypothetical protein
MSHTIEDSIRIAFERNAQGNEVVTARGSKATKMTSFTKQYNGYAGIANPLCKSVAELVQNLFDALASDKGRMLVGGFGEGAKVAYVWLLRHGAQIHIEVRAAAEEPRSGGVIFVGGDRVVLQNTATTAFSMQTLDAGASTKERADQTNKCSIAQMEFVGTAVRVADFADMPSLPSPSVGASSRHWTTRLTLRWDPKNVDFAKAVHSSCIPLVLHRAPRPPTIVIQHKTFVLRVFEAPRDDGGVIVYWNGLYLDKVVSSAGSSSAEDSSFVLDFYTGVTLYSSRDRELDFSALASAKLPAGALVDAKAFAGLFFARARMEMLSRMRRLDDLFAFCVRNFKAELKEHWPRDLMPAVNLPNGRPRPAPPGVSRCAAPVAFYDLCDPAACVPWDTPPDAQLTQKANDFIADVKRVANASPRTITVVVLPMDYNVFTVMQRAGCFAQLPHPWLPNDRPYFFHCEFDSAIQRLYVPNRVPTGGLLELILKSALIRWNVVTIEEVTELVLQHRAADLAGDREKARKQKEEAERAMAASMPTARRFTGTMEGGSGDSSGYYMPHTVCCDGDSLTVSLVKSACAPPTQQLSATSGLDSVHNMPHTTPRRVCAFEHSKEEECLVQACLAEDAELGHVGERLFWPVTFDVAAPVATTYPYSRADFAKAYKDGLAVLHLVRDEDAAALSDPYTVLHVACGDGDTFCIYNAIVPLAATPDLQGGPFVPYGAYRYLPKTLERVIAMMKKSHVSLHMAIAAELESRDYGSFAISNMDNAEQPLQCLGKACVLAMLYAAFGYPAFVMINNPNGDGHAWTAVRMHGVYRYIDATRHSQKASRLLQTAEVTHAQRQLDDIASVCRVTGSDRDRVVDEVKARVAGAAADWQTVHVERAPAAALDMNPEQQQEMREWRQQMATRRRHYDEAMRAREEARKAREEEAREAREEDAPHKEEDASKALAHIISLLDVPNRTCRIDVNGQELVVRVNQNRRFTLKQGDIMLTNKQGELMAVLMRLYGAPRRGDGAKRRADDEPVAQGKGKKRRAAAQKEEGKAPRRKETAQKEKSKAPRRKKTALDADLENDGIVVVGWRGPVGDDDPDYLPSKKERPVDSIWRTRR